MVVEELWQVARLIRSKNAGPFELTLDVVCDTEAAFDRIRGAGIMEASKLATLFGVDATAVRTYEHPLAFALKATIIRPQPAGDLGDTDVFGGQFHSPIVCQPVPPLRADAQGGATRN